MGRNWSRSKREVRPPTSSQTMTLSRRPGGTEGIHDMSCDECVVVIGAGPRFLSGISYYTHDLATAPAPGPASARSSCAGSYPGAGIRVVRTSTSPWSTSTGPASARCMTGVDWFWLGSLRPAISMLRAAPADGRRPAVVDRRRPAQPICCWRSSPAGSAPRWSSSSTRCRTRASCRCHSRRRYVKAVMPLLLRLAGAVRRALRVRPEPRRRAHALRGRPVCRLPHPVPTTADRR